LKALSLACVTGDIFVEAIMLYESYKTKTPKHGVLRGKTFSLFLVEPSSLVF